MSDAVNHHKWWVLVSISLFLLVINLNITIVALALSHIGAALSLSFSTLQWVSNGYTLSAAFCLIPFGSLARRWSNRTIYLFAVGLFTLGSLLSGLTDHVSLLIAGRVLQGIGFAGLPLGIVIVNHAFPKEVRGVAYSISVASVGIGLALGPIIGSWLLDYFTWHSIFYVNVLIGLLCLLSSMSLIQPDKPVAKAADFDYLGTFWLGMSLISSMYLLSHVRWWGWSAMPSILWAATSVFAIIALVRHVNRHPRPIFEPAIFKQRNASLFLFLRAIFMIGFAVVLFAMPLQLQNIEGFDASYAANLMLVMTLIMTVLSPFCGRMIDRIGFKIPTILATLFCFLAHVLFATLPEHELAMTILALAAFGVSAALMFSAGTYGMSHSLSMAHKSIGMGLFFTLANIGISIGVTLSGSFISFLSERAISEFVGQQSLTLSTTTLNAINKMATGVVPLKAPASLVASWPTWKPVIEKAFMGGLHGLMWLCAVLALVQLLGAWMLQADAHVDE